MAKKTSNLEFEALIRSSLSSEERVIEAAHDPLLRGSMEWLLLGKTDLLTDWELEGEQGLDAQEIHRRIAEKHGLDEIGLEEAVNLCGTLVEEGELNA